ncbi:MAG: hypothetical protein WAU07_04275 [Microgenomates group bacterium]
MTSLRTKEFACIVTVLLLLGAYILLTDVTQIFAQTEAESTPAIEELQILEQELPPEITAVDELQTLTTLYKSQIEKYRTSERQFNLDKQQYAQLKTLVSLEVAVRSTREVYLDRSKVLITYLELVEYTLRDTPGIELGAKEGASQVLATVKTDLLTHQDDILLSEDRIALSARASEFAELSPKITNASYRALLLVRMGKIQTLYDQSLMLFEDILQYHIDTPGSALQESQRGRAREEIERSLETTKESLETITREYKNLEEAEKSINRNTYNRMTSDLSTPYSQLSKVLSYLGEFITI